MRVCSMFQLHVQATVSRGAHVYHGSCTHVFDCHRWGQCGSIECAHFCPSFGLKSSIKCSNFEPQFVVCIHIKSNNNNFRESGGHCPPLFNISRGTALAPCIYFSHKTEFGVPHLGCCFTRTPSLGVPVPSKKVLGIIQTPCHFFYQHLGVDLCSSSFQGAWEILHTAP